MIQRFFLEFFIWLLKAKYQAVFCVLHRQCKWMTNILCEWKPHLQTLKVQSFHKHFQKCSSLQASTAAYCENCSQFQVQVHGPNTVSYKSKCLTMLPFLIHLEVFVLLDVKPLSWIQVHISLEISDSLCILVNGSFSVLVIKIGRHI